MPREVRTCSKFSRISVPGAATRNAAASTFISGPTPKKSLRPLANPVPEDFSLVPWVAVRAVAVTMTDALNDHDEDGWRKIPRREHIARALRHLTLHLIGDKSEDHLPHAACRVLFALECE